MSIRRLPLAVALLALAAACHSTIPTDIGLTQIYLLQSINGQPLPTTKPRDPAATVLHEELILNGLGVATRSTTVRRSTATTDETSSVSYAYTIEGDVVTIGDFICTGNVPCANHLPEQGTTDGNILTLGPMPGISSVPGPVLVYGRATFVD